MTTWTEQPGFPVVTVAIKNGVVTLQQQRFLLRNLKSTPTNLTWSIPITWTTQENPNFNRINVGHWLQNERDTINISQSSGWVIFNVQSAGELLKILLKKEDRLEIFETYLSKEEFVVRYPLRNNFKKKFFKMNLRDNYAQRLKGRILYVTRGI